MESTAGVSSSTPPMPSSTQHTSAVSATEAPAAAQPQGGAGSPTSDDYKDWKAAFKRNKEIEEALKVEAKQQTEQSLTKILLLGAAESGKSTVFKQMGLAHGVGFSDSERKQFRAVIYGNVIDAAQCLLRHLQEVPEELKAAKDLVEAIQIDQSTEMVKEISEPSWDALQTIWAHSSIQTLYQDRSQMQLKEATS